MLCSATSHLRPPDEPIGAGRLSREGAAAAAAAAAAEGAQHRAPGRRGKTGAAGSASAARAGARWAEPSFWGAGMATPLVIARHVDLKVSCEQLVPGWS